MTAAAHFLTVESVLQCAHGGSVTGSTRNTRVKADGSFVLRSTDTFLVKGCKHTIGNVPHPCVRVRWDVHAERHESLGAPSLTEDSVGYCLAGDGAMQGTVVVSSTQIRGGSDVIAERHDYAFPFRIDLESRQAQQVSLERHVAQLVQQVLLTGPGERVDLPEFGCGLRAFVFAGNSEAVAATAQMLVQHSLTRWLSDHLEVRTVEVTSEEASIVVLVEYVLVRTGRNQRVEMRVS